MRRSIRRMARSFSEHTIWQDVTGNRPAFSWMCNLMSTRDWSRNPLENGFTRYLIAHAYDDPGGDIDIASLCAKKICGESTCHSSIRPTRTTFTPLPSVEGATDSGDQACANAIEPTSRCLGRAGGDLP